MRVPFLAFLLCVILEVCPIEGYNWNFGWWWFLIMFLTLVEVSIYITKVQADRKDK